MKKILLVRYLYILIIVAFENAHAQHFVQNQYKFKYLTIDQGLSNNNVRAICQDSKGFIWIATQNGLNKFNGQTFVNYKHKPQDSTTISADFTTSVFLDSKSQLWIGSTGGLDIYNNDINNFTRFSHKDINWQLEYVEAIVEDKNGILWIAEARGLIAYNLETKEVQHFSNEIGNLHGIPPNRIYKLLVDRKNNIWVSVLNEGLCVYHQDKGTFECYKNDPLDSASISGHRIEVLYEDHDGNIWAGTLNYGINRFVPETKSFKRIIPDPENSYSTRIRTIFEDPKNNFYVGTRSGIYLKENEKDEFIHYAYEDHKFSDISQNSVQCSFIDNAGTLWIGTFSGGVNYTNFKRKEFAHFIAGNNDNHLLLGSNIYAITEDAKGNLWIGSDNGLNYLDRNSYTFKYYVNDPKDPNSLSYNDVKAFEWDKNGNLWIGTNRGGLNYFNVKTGLFKSYRHDPKNENSISSDKIYGLMRDKDDNLWILSSVDNEVNFMNIDILPSGSDKFIHYDQKAYFGLAKDNAGNVYIGSFNGFWMFSREDSAFSFIAHKEHIGAVNCITIDTENNVWIGSDKGLCRYYVEDKTFARYSEVNDYPIGDVFGILEDNDKGLWVSTNNGLVKIEHILKDSTNASFRVFDTEDGLQSKQFNYNAYFKSNSGEMAFGGVNGFNTFFPDKIIENMIPADIVLTDLKIYNMSVPIGDKVNGRVILTKSISVTDEITLGPNQNFFTIEFASLQYSNSGKDIFKFMLDGLDEGWQSRKASNNFASYTNVAPGKYTFLVTAVNNDGFWNEKPLRLKITILPPLWKTWWFRILFVLFIGLIILLFFYLRTRNLVARNTELERKVNERTNQLNKLVLELQEKKDEIETTNEELSATLEDLFMQKTQIEKMNIELNRTHLELKEINNQLDSRVQERTSELLKANQELDRFVYSASHDLSAPLKSIMGLIHIATLENRKNDLTNHLLHMEKSVKKLEDVIKSLTQYSRNNGQDVQLTEFIFDALLTEVLDEIHNAAFNNSIDIIRDFDPYQVLKSDVLRIKIIITNLISNAIKYRKRDIPDSHIKISVMVENGYYFIRVKDNGIGIEKVYLDRIFEMFYRATTTSKGSGLGLYIVKEIVDRLKGKISVESIFGEFTEVVVKLPVL